MKMRWGKEKKLNAKGFKTSIRRKREEDANMNKMIAEEKNNNNIMQECREKEWDSRKRKETGCKCNKWGCRNKDTWDNRWKPRKEIADNTKNSWWEPTNLTISRSKATMTCMALVTPALDPIKMPAMGRARLIWAILVNPLNFHPQSSTLTVTVDHLWSQRVDVVAVSCDHLPLS